MTTMLVRKEAMLLNIDFQGFFQADRANGMRDIGGKIYLGPALKQDDHDADYWRRR